MKKILMLIAAVAVISGELCAAGGGKSAMEEGGVGQEGMVVVFWNLENFFDWMAEGEGDREFSSGGGRRWTRKRFHKKCDAVAKGLMWMGERYGRMPDVVGLAEVENRGVLTRMLSSTALRKYGYRVVHFESGDRRGIDVALMYRESSMELVSESVKTPEYNGEKMATRDILHVCMRLEGGQKMDFIVNHHPSKFGGERESEGRRTAAMRALKEVYDSLMRPDDDWRYNESLTGSRSRTGIQEREIIAMGDFNDTPDAESFGIISGTLVNKGLELYQKGEGTIRYEGKWDLIDMFMVSEALAGRTEMEICRIPFLMTREKKHPGEKPLRTYSGPRYVGGVSDHLPIVLKIL